MVSFMAALFTLVILAPFVINVIDWMAEKVEENPALKDYYAPSCYGLLLVSLSFFAIVRG